MQLKIGIIRETKSPPDSRTPLTPSQCKIAESLFPVSFIVQPADFRCFSNQEYIEAGIQVQENISDSHILLSIKEVKPDTLLPNKTYCMFSHTIKEQAHNRILLQTILQKNIRLIDYELITEEKGNRLIAFGHFAGMVGAHNAIYTYGQRTQLFSLPRMKDLKDYADAQLIYTQTQFPPIKIIVTGTGRVGKGASQVLSDMGIIQVNKEDFLAQTYPFPVFCVLKTEDYIVDSLGQPIQKEEYHHNPQGYQSRFLPFAAIADIFINCIFWDNRAPKFFDFEDMAQPEFSIKVIADVTCDIAPLSSIPSTLRASTIPEPVYGVDPIHQKEIAPYQSHGIDVMAIDNLPNELPRDASVAFGEQVLKYLIPEFLKEKESPLLERAIIAKDGQLTPHFEYLQGFVNKVD